MRFELKTARDRYDDDRKEKLEGLGFTFEPCTSYAMSKSFEPFVIESWLKREPNPTIEITSFDELMALVEAHQPVIVESNAITIYDGYLE